MPAFEFEILPQDNYSLRTASWHDNPENVTGEIDIPARSITQRHAIDNQLKSTSRQLGFRCEPRSIQWPGRITILTF